MRTDTGPSRSRLDRFLSQLALMAARVEQVTPRSTEMRPEALSPSKLMSPLSVTAAAGKWNVNA